MYDLFVFPWFEYFFYYTFEHTLYSALCQTQTPSFKVVLNSDKGDRTGKKNLYYLIDSGEKLHTYVKSKWN